MATVSFNDLHEALFGRATIVCGQRESGRTTLITNCLIPALMYYRGAQPFNCAYIFAPTDYRAYLALTRRICDVSEFREIVQEIRSAATTRRGSNFLIVIDDAPMITRTREFVEFLLSARHYGTTIIVSTISPRDLRPAERAAFANAFSVPRATLRDEEPNDNSRARAPATTPSLFCFVAQIHIGEEHDALFDLQVEDYALAIRAVGPFHLPYSLHH